MKTFREKLRISSQGGFKTRPYCTGETLAIPFHLEGSPWKP
jgi:hypothetical protein